MGGEGGGGRLSFIILLPPYWGKSIIICGRCVAPDWHDWENPPRQEQLDHHFPLMGKRNHSSKPKRAKLASIWEIQCISFLPFASATCTEGGGPKTRETSQANSDSILLVSRRIRQRTFFSLVSFLTDRGSRLTHISSRSSQSPFIPDDICKKKDDYKSHVLVYAIYTCTG